MKFKQLLKPLSVTNMESFPLLDQKFDLQALDKCRYFPF